MAWTVAVGVSVVAVILGRIAWRGAALGATSYWLSVTLTVLFVLVGFAIAVAVATDRVERVDEDPLVFRRLRLGVARDELRIARRDVGGVWPVRPDDGSSRHLLVATRDSLHAVRFAPER